MTTVHDSRFEVCLHPANGNRHELSRLTIGVTGALPTEADFSIVDGLFLGQTGDAALAEDLENRPIDIDSR
jgi:hypothetical protein